MVLQFSTRKKFSGHGGQVFLKKRDLKRKLHTLSKRDLKKKSHAHLPHVYGHKLRPWWEPRIRAKIR